MNNLEQKDTLNRAKNLLGNSKLTDLDLVELSILMNEYIDFLSDDNYLNNSEKEGALRKTLNAFCDNLEESFKERSKIRIIRY